MQKIFVKIDPNSLKKIEYDKDIEYKLPDKITRKVLRNSRGEAVGVEETIVKVTRTYDKLWGEYYYQYLNFLEHCTNCGHYLTLSNIYRDLKWEPKKLDDFKMYNCEKCNHPIEIEFEDLEKFLKENENPIL